jgi:hypothetical protein
MIKKLKFALWLIRVMRSLSKEDCASLKSAIDRLMTYEDEKYMSNNGDITRQQHFNKALHQAIMSMVPQGVGYVFVANSLASDRSRDRFYEGPPAFQTLSMSNLKDEDAIRVMETSLRSLKSKTFDKSKVWPSEYALPIEEIDIGNEQQYSVLDDVARDIPQ